MNKYLSILLIVSTLSCASSNTPSEISPCKQMVDTFCRKAIECFAYDNNLLNKCNEVVYERVIGLGAGNELSCTNLNKKIENLPCKLFLEDYMGKKSADESL